MFLLHQSMEKYHCVFPTIFDIQKYLNLIYKWRTLFRICAKNGADCYSKNGDAVTVLTWQN